jgi:transcription antitermination factor NusG
MGIESYLPMHKVMRQWSDRKKKLEVPLFPNYVFVKVDDLRRRYLYTINEIVRFVSIENRPVVVREKDILMIKAVLNNDLDVSSEEDFKEGMAVRIVSGQFVGVEGVLVKKGGNSRLLVRLDSVSMAFSFNIYTRMVKSVPLVSA